MSLVRVPTMLLLRTRILGKVKNKALLYPQMVWS